MNVYGELGTVVGWINCLIDSSCKCMAALSYGFPCNNWILFLWKEKVIYLQLGLGLGHGISLQQRQTTIVLQILVKPLKRKGHGSSRNRNVVEVRKPMAGSWLCTGGRLCGDPYWPTRKADPVQLRHWPLNLERNFWEIYKSSCARCIVTLPAAWTSPGLPSEDSRKAMPYGYKN